MRRALPNTFISASSRQSPGRETFMADVPGAVIHVGWLGRRTCGLRRFPWWGSTDQISTSIQLAAACRTHGIENR